MPRDSDPMAIHHSVMESVVGHLEDAQAAADKRLVTAPAVGEEVGRDEQRHQYLRMLSDPMLLEFFVQDFAQNATPALTPERPIPRDLFNALRDAHKSFGPELADRERRAQPPEHATFAVERERRY